MAYWEAYNKLNELALCGKRVQVCPFIRRFLNRA